VCGETTILRANFASIGRVTGTGKIEKIQAAGRIDPYALSVPEVTNARTELWTNDGNALGIRNNIEAIIPLRRKKKGHFGPLVHKWSKTMCWSGAQRAEFFSF
jgi:hypothetical protein